jgi:hypothetical protein
MGAMPLAGFHHYSTSLHTPAAQGDGTAAFVIGAVVIVLAWLLIAIGKAKSNRYSPRDKAPFSGIYEANLRQEARFGKGRTIPPPKPNTSGPNWQLKKAEVSEGWIWVAVLLGILGVLAYSQINVPQAEEAVSHALTSGPALRPEHPSIGHPRPPTRSGRSVAYGHHPSRVHPYGRRLRRRIR